MPHLRALWRRLPIGLFCLVALALVAGCWTPGQYPQSTLEPKSDYTGQIDHLFRITVWLATIVFIAVEGALLFAIFRFRGKPDDPEPTQHHGNTTVELIWTIIPAVVLAVVAVPTVRTILKTAVVPTSSPDGQKPLKVEVIGHQWWWEFRYPDLGITTAGEWHLPRGRMIDLRMRSIDVIHSFWVPQFAAKRDVFPNRETRLAFVPDSTGKFPGACAEFCGTQHGRMDFLTVIDEPTAFDAWVGRRLADSVTVSMTPPVAPKDSVVIKALAAVDPVVQQGEDLFRAKGCVGCHVLNSAKNVITGLPGPNLAGIGTRAFIAGGWLPNTDENLLQWIVNPQQFKHGIVMRPKNEPEISEFEAKALVAYLRTKR